MNRQTRAPPAWTCPETSATALLAQPRPRWAGGVYTGPTRATPNEGGLTLVRCTLSPVSLTQNHTWPAEPAQHLRTVRYFVRTGTARAARLLVGVADECAEPLCSQFHVVLSRGRQVAGHRSRPHQPTELVQPRVLADLDPAPAEPGHLGGEQFNRRKGPVDREYLLLAFVQRPGQGHGRLAGHRQQEQRVGRNRRGAHPGTRHSAGCVPDHQPPVPARLRDPVSLLRQHPVSDGGHDRADHRVDGQVVTGRSKELARIGAELQRHSGNRDSAHLRTLAADMPHRHPNFCDLAVVPFVTGA